MKWFVNWFWSLPFVTRYFRDEGRQNTLLGLLYLYWRGRAGGGRRGAAIRGMNTHNARREADQEHPVDTPKSLSYRDDTLIGVWDFRASPFAVGDILTWVQRLQIEALNLGKKHIDICVLADRFGPSNINQRQISPGNYQKYLVEMMPLFYSVPNVRNVHFFQDRQMFEAWFVMWTMEDVSASPGLSDYVYDADQMLAAYNSHDIVNAYHAKHGEIPYLESPKGTRSVVMNLLSPFRNRFLVAVHLRRRSMEGAEWGNSCRDAVMDDWLDFFERVERNHPEVLFMVVGRPVEWPRELYRRANIFIIKTMGYGLPEEMALIQECDMFIGSNSGPAVMAVFGRKPYLIFQSTGNAHESAFVYDVPEGTERLPFAGEHQRYHWGDADKNVIYQRFETMYSALDGKTHVIGVD